LAGLQSVSLSLLLATSLVATSSQAGDAQSTAHGDGVAVRIVRSGAADSASGEVSGVVLNIEVTEDAAADLYGYRSMNSVADIDCRSGRDRVRSARAFERRNQSGASNTRRTSGEWVLPTPGAYMSDVIEKVCSRAGLRPSSPTIATAVPTAVSTAPLAAPNPTVSRMASPSAPAPDLARTGGGATRFRAQLASSSSEGAAREILEQARTKVLPPLTGDVETAEVHGKKVYRSVVEGFGSEAEAQAFCVRMKQARGDCIVWKGTNTSGR
jgi:hypothetical protein